jgi:hypothetical protein
MKSIKANDKSKKKKEDFNEFIKISLINFYILLKYFYNIGLSFF